MHLLSVAGLRPGLFAHPLYRRLVQHAEVTGALGEGAAQGDGAGAALLQGRVVQVGVGLGVQHLVGEGGGLRGVAGMEADLARLDSRQHPLQPLQVHRLVQAVVHRLPHQRVVRQVYGAGDVLLAGHDAGEDGCQQVVRAHPLYWRRHPFALALSKDGQGAGGVPAPAGREQGYRQQRLG